MSKDALAKQARRSSPDLAGSHASLPSISDLGDEYLQAGGPRTPSLASTDDQLEDRDRPSRLSGPPSPSQQLTRSFASDGPSALDAAHPSTSRHSSSVTFGPTTATYFSQQPPNDSEEPLSRPDVARGRLPTDETGLLSDAQQPHRAAYGSTLSTSRLDRAAATDRAESPSPSPHASLRSPGTHRIRKKLAKTASFVGLRRAQSYDEGLGAGTTDVNVVSNGTRHWTASFSSVDWVHDSVKGEWYGLSVDPSQLPTDGSISARCLSRGQHPQPRPTQLAVEGLPSLGPTPGLGRRHIYRCSDCTGRLRYRPRCVGASIHLLPRPSLTLALSRPQARAGCSTSKTATAPSRTAAGGSAEAFVSRPNLSRRLRPLR